MIDTSTGTIYLVAKSKVNGSLVQYLHAIDVATKAEKFGGPVLIQATVPGTASDGNGTTVSFSPHFENQRAGLLLENGHVVIGWSSHCDISPWHGWIMSYSASTLAQEAAFNTSADGSANGVWMSGGGLAADSNGNIFFATGNGTWNGTTDYGDSIVKLGPPEWRQLSGCGLLHAIQPEQFVRWRHRRRIRRIGVAAQPCFRTATADADGQGRQDVSD